MIWRARLPRASSQFLHDRYLVRRAPEPTRFDQTTQTMTMPEQALAGAAPQLVEHGKTGFLFPPKNPVAMVAALEECLSRRESWSEIGRRARAAVAPYDLRAVVAAYVRLCNEVTEVPKPGTSSNIS